MGAQAVHASARDIESVTPHDSINFTGGTAKRLYIGVGGDVAVVNTNGDVVTYVGFQGGRHLNVECIRVNATNTTATNIIAERW